jgi:hypothetical protein
MPAYEVVKHFEELSFKGVVHSDSVEERFCFPGCQDWQSMSHRSFDRVDMFRVIAGYVFPCARFHAGQVHLWLKMVAPVSVPDHLEQRRPLHELHRPRLPHRLVIGRDRGG